METAIWSLRGACDCSTLCPWSASSPSPSFAWPLARYSSPTAAACRLAGSPPRERDAAPAGSPCPQPRVQGALPRVPGPQLSALPHRSLPSIRSREPRRGGHPRPRRRSLATRAQPPRSRRLGAPLLPSPPIPRAHHDPHPRVPRPLPIALPRPLELCGLARGRGRAAGGDPEAGLQPESGLSARVARPW